MNSIQIHSILIIFGYPAIIRDDFMKPGPICSDGSVGFRGSHLSATKRYGTPNCIPQVTICRTGRESPDPSSTKDPRRVSLHPHQRSVKRAHRTSSDSPRLTTRQYSSNQQTLDSIFQLTNPMPSLWHQLRLKIPTHVPK